MNLLPQILIGAIAGLHFYFMWFEMFAWTRRGKKVFKHFPPELFEPTKPLAANQGLYNGFLAAGLIWSLFIDDPGWQRNVACFFLGCVLLAGIFGALTADRRIFFIQGLPAAATLVLLLLS